MNLKSTLVACIPFTLIMTLSCSTLETRPTTTLVLEDRLKSLVEKLSLESPEMSLGLSVVRVHDKKILFSHDTQKLFTPASTAKTITIAAALHYLGPEARFDTEIFTQERNGSKIRNLYLKASGDPSLSSSDLAKLIAELKQLGIRTVDGDIVVDAALFDDVPYAQGWMESDLTEGFSAPVNAVSLDSNRIVFGLFAGNTAETPISYTAFPNTQYFNVANKAQTTSTDTKHDVKISLPQDRGITSKSTILIEGSLPASSNTKYETLAISDPVEFAGFIVREELQKNGISFKGKLSPGQVPKDAQLITHHLSDTLSKIIINISQSSNNNATEMLLKNIAVKQRGAPGTFANGILAVRQFLETKAGVQLKGYAASDGSGLSRYNQLSATQLTDLLTYMYNNYDIGPEFVAALVRMDSNDSLVRAKSGSMRSVRNLAGYVRLETGDIAAFAMLTYGAASNPNLQKQKFDFLKALSGVK